MTTTTPSNREVQIIRQFASSQPYNGSFQEAVRSALWHELSSKGDREGDFQDKNKEYLMQLVTTLRTKAERADETSRNNTLYRGLPFNIIRTGKNSKKFEVGSIHKWSSFTWVSRSLEGAKLSMTRSETTSDSCAMEGTLFVLRISESMPKNPQGCWGYNLSRITRAVAPFQGLFFHLFDS